MARRLGMRLARLTNSVFPWLLGSRHNSTISSELPTNRYLSWLRLHERGQIGEIPREPHRHKGAAPVSLLNPSILFRGSQAARDDRPYAPARPNSIDARRMEYLSAVRI
jgi:hypothetical protein